MGNVSGRGAASTERWRYKLKVGYGENPRPAVQREESLRFQSVKTLKGWKRVFPKGRYLVVHWHSVQRQFMTFGIVPIAEIDFLQCGATKLSSPYRGIPK